MPKNDEIRKPLMGSVETRELRTMTTYRAIWRADGAQQKKTFDTLDEACDYLDEMAIGVRRGGQVTNVTKARTTFSIYAEAWIADEARDVKKKRSILDAQLLPAFGEKPLGEITRRHVQQWVNSLAFDPDDCDLCLEVQAVLSDDDARCRKHKGATSASPSSIHTYYAILGKLMRTAQLDGYLPNGCPVGKGLVELPDIEKRMVILNDAQSDGLLEVCLKEFPAQAALIHIASHTGMRIGELMGLHRLAYNGNSLLVNSALKATGRIGTTKTNRARRIVLMPCCTKVMDEHLSGHEYDLVFAAPGGGAQMPTNWRRRYWYPIRKAAGLESLDLHFHDLRHTHCTNLLAAGWEITVVAERMGHKSTKMTLDVYGHAIPGRQEALLLEKGLRVS